MSHPFQRLRTALKSRYLIAASGSNLYVLNCHDGHVVSQWNHQDCVKVDNNSRVKDEQRESSTTQSHNDGPPQKKQKTKASSIEAPNFILLEITPDEKRVIGVTGEDKCVLVFTVSDEGQLKLESIRAMSRRPSALALLPDGQNLLVADKFGDLYMLPVVGFAGDQPVIKPAEAVKSVLMPAATNKTVHSGRNLATLEFQMKQALAGENAKTKQQLDFRHKLLLGHVSMLTDVVCATVPAGVDGETRQNKTYIITADRDEHIRVSRSPPQAHVIEKFCLAHTEFVSKICLLPDCFVSGGGDDDLFVWSWPRGTLLGRIPLRPHLQALFPPDVSEIQEEFAGSKVAITGIWAVAAMKDTVLVACEGIPALFSVRTSLPVEEAVTTLKLPGNALDVVVFGTHIVVSVDSRQEAECKTDKRLHAYTLDKDLQWSQNQDLDQAMGALNQLSTVPIKDKITTSLLYSTEQLRKRAGFGDDHADD